jgi:uncharacterized protein (DUF2267 family)
MSLVLENLNPDAQHQLEDVAAELGIAPGDFARRMIETAFMGDEQARFRLYFSFSHEIAHILLAHDFEIRLKATLEKVRDRMQAEGADTPQKIRNLLVQGLLPGSFQQTTAIQPREEPANTEADRKRLALIAKLQQWNVEDATQDPEEIARREARWGEIQSNLEANRVSLPVLED